MEKVSVIIPSYNCRFAARTVDDAFSMAKGPVEVVCLLDGYSPDPPIKPRRGLILINKEKTTGMRNSINMGAQIATGKYIMKVDDHCTFSEGYDEALKAGSEDSCISIPSRYSLDVVNWKTQREPVSYEYMTYPYVYLDRYRYGCGLVAKKWWGEKGINPPNTGYEQYYWKEHKLAHVKIDEISIFHGSCWFMPRDHFFKIGCLDEVMFKTLYQEPQELAFKTWLSGGKVVVNKNAWYAHMFKGPDFGEVPNQRGYRLDLTAMRETERFGTWYWMNDQWPGATKKMKWLIEKFWPIPGWPEDWEEQKVEWDKKYPFCTEGSWLK